MVITQGAAEILDRVQTQRALPHAPRIEVGASSANFVMVMTDPTVDDEVLYYGRTPVLYISASAAELLEDCMLTTKETSEGVGLTVAPRENCRRPAC